MEKNRYSKDSLPWFKSQSCYLPVSWSNSDFHLINGDNKSQFHLCRTVVNFMIQFMWSTYNAYQIISDDSGLDHKFQKSQRPYFISFASPWYIRNFIERHHLLGHCRYNELFLTFFFLSPSTWNLSEALFLLLLNFLAFI